MKLAIVAGGEATRLRTVAGTTPKCLIPIGGQPVLGHQLDLAHRHGVSEVWLLTGRGSEQIEAYVRTSEWPGMDIQVVREPEPLGTAGTFLTVADRWEGTLLVIYGDLLCNVDLQRLYRFHRRQGGHATLFAHPNDHPFDSDLLEVGHDDRITTIHRKPHPPGVPRGNLVNGAVYALEPALVELLTGGKSDWAHDVFPLALRSGFSLFAYRSSEYVRDMGTPERLSQAEDDWENGLLGCGSYATLRPAVVVDCRRSVAGDEESFEMSERFIELMRRLNVSRFVSVLLTDVPQGRQPALETALSQYGVYGDVICIADTTDRGRSDTDRVSEVMTRHRLDPRASVRIEPVDGCLHALNNAAPLSPPTELLRLLVPIRA